MWTESLTSFLLRSEAWPELLCECCSYASQQTPHPGDIPPHLAHGGR